MAERYYFDEDYYDYRGEINDRNVISTFCNVIKDSEDEGRLYLQDIPLNMTIRELKRKVYNDHHIPVNSQYWLLNGMDTEDDGLIEYYVDDTIEENAFSLCIMDAPVNNNDNRNNNNNINRSYKERHYIRYDDEYDQDFEENIDHNSWKCPKCTYKNKIDDFECNACSYINNMLAPKKRKEKFDSYMAFQETDIVENTEPFSCQICLEDDVEPGDGVILKECLHVFCKDCLKDHIIRSTSGSVKCPYGGDYTCQSNILEREIRALITPQELEKLHLRGLREAEAQLKTFHCKTVNCVGFCEYENLDIFICPVCNALNCIKCKAQHTEKTCEQYIEDGRIKKQNDKNARIDEEAIKKMIKDGQAMKCPGCRTLVLKDQGCDWILCFICKMEICWATKGPRWGPKGNGDYSGGCKCNYNQKRCTPNCQNCH